MAIRAFQKLWPLVSGAAGLWRRALSQTRVVTVVGSYGKTSTRFAIRHVLGLAGPEIQLGNVRGYVPRALLQVSRKDRYAVLEVAIDGLGQMRKHARIVRPDVVVVTSIGSEHNRSLRTLETTRDEKAEMVRVLPPKGIAFLNGDDPNVLWMAGQTCARVITFGTKAHNQIRASDIRLEWPEGTRFRLHLEGNSYEVFPRVFGDHMIYPLLAALGVGSLAQVPLGKMLTRIGEITPCRNRLNTFQLKNGAILVRDEIKSSYETIHAALDFLKKVPAERKYLVLGDVSEPPGPVGPLYRQIGGRFPECVTDVVIIGSNCQRYRSEARRNGFPGDRILDARHDLHEAARFLQEKLRPQDVVLVKGRDNQKLDRLSLMLMGKGVGCRLKVCKADNGCDICPSLNQKGRP